MNSTKRRKTIVNLVLALLLVAAIAVFTTACFGGGSSGKTGGGSGSENTGGDNPGGNTGDNTGDNPGGEDEPDPPHYVNIWFNDGSSSYKQEVVANQQIDAPTEPTRLGYEFKGWFTALSGGTKRNFPLTPTEGMKSYAQWTVIRYNLTFHAPFAYTPTKSTYNVTQAFTLGVPNAYGYEFLGWYEDEACSGEPITAIEKGSTGDRDFYAKANLKSYSLSYELNGGENDLDNPATYDVNDANIILKPPVKRGFDFKGWYATSDFSGSASNVVFTSSCKDLVRYAKWQIATYQITYHLDGGTLRYSNPASYTYETPDFALKLPTKPHYNFEGWYFDDQFAAQVPSEFDTSILQDSDIYAKWSTVKSNVTYSLAGGINNPANISVFDIETLNVGGENSFTLNAPSRDGYRFRYWYKASEPQTAVTAIDTSVEGDVELYALWKNELLYTYQFYLMTDGTYSVRLLSGGELPSADLTLPSEYEGKAVTAVAQGGFYRCKGVNSVTLPPSIKKVYSNAFEQSSVTRVDLGSATLIGYKAFYDTAIAELFIPISVRTIEANSVHADTIKCAASSFPTEGWDLTALNGTISWRSGWLTEGDYSYAVCGENAYLTKYNGTAESVEVPSQIGGYTVCSIEKAFNGAQCVKRLTLPQGLTTLYGGAFTSTSIAAVQLPLSMVLLQSGVASEEVIFATESDTAPTSYQAANTLLLSTRIETENDIYYCKTDTAATLLRYVGVNGASVPQTLGGKPVTEIGSNAYANVNFGSLTLSYDLTKICAKAFSGCSFTALKISSAQTVTEDNAFENCTYGSLTVSAIPIDGSGNGNLGAVFGDLSNLSEIAVQTVTAIPPRTFENLKKLERASLGASVKTVGEYAFYGCDALTDVNLGAAESVGNSAFSGCTSLDVTVGLSVTTVADTAFANCGIIYCAHASKPSGYVERWASGAAVVYFGAAEIFKESGLQYLITDSKAIVTKIPVGGNITVPATLGGYSVAKIGAKAAYRNDSITSLTVAADIEEIGKNAFEQCSHLTSVTLDGVGKIDSSAFAYCGELASLNSAEIAQIGDNAFRNDTLLSTFITSAQSATSIGYCAFYSCAALGAIDLSALSTLGEMAFYGCASLQSVDLPQALTAVPGGAFYGATKLSSVTLSEGLLSITGQLGGGSILAPFGSTAVTSLTLPSTLKTIGASAFANLNLSGAIEVPVGVTSIGDGAFSGVRATSIILKCKLSALGAYAFRGCGTRVLFTEHSGDTELPVNSFNGYAFAADYFTSIDLPANVTTIRDGAFANSALKYFEMPYNVTRQGSGMFAGATSLTYLKVYFLGATSLDNTSTYKYLFGSAVPSTFAQSGNLLLFDARSKVIAPSAFENFAGTVSLCVGNITSFTQIGARAFAGTKLTSFLTTADLTLGVGAFQNCTSLTAFEARSVATISESTFSGCTSLNSFKLTLPNKLTKICRYAFQSCTSLGSLVLSTYQTTIQGYAFRLSSIVLKCKMSSKLSGWETNWSNGATVTWNYTGT